MSEWKCNVVGIQVLWVEGDLPRGGENAQRVFAGVGIECQSCTHQFVQITPLDGPIDPNLGSSNIPTLFFNLMTFLPALAGCVSLALCYAQLKDWYQPHYVHSFV